MQENLFTKEYVSQFLGFYVGGEFERNDGGKITGMFWVQHTRYRYSSKHIYESIHKASYVITKQLYISGNYDSREHFGLDLALRF
ncbi:MAG: hypothetical protein K2X53_00085 [Alphaproteobacteria bacterium]|nr:hypothetical protein [Alphaproteobacteria bacterium]